MKHLEAKIGVQFNDTRLLQSAFIHRSFMHEHPENLPGLTSNERLEFLGDAILNYLTATLLYTRFPQNSEGQLTELRASLVRTETLAAFARILGLGELVRISRGEDTPVGRNRASLLANLFEALVGAIYLDQGPEVTKRVVTPFLEQQLDLIERGAVHLNYRTRLQELAQGRFGETPEYRELEASGPPHQLTFTVAVLIQGQVLGEGRGSTKQAAAQAAAQMALAVLAE